MKRDSGYTLILTLGIIALLGAVAALLSGPTSTEQRRVDVHYGKVQAGYLSLAGVEQAKAWAAKGIVTNAVYPLAEGTVDTTMERLKGNDCRVISVGRVSVSQRAQPIEARSEVTIQLP